MNSLEKIEWFKKDGWTIAGDYVYKDDLTEITKEQWDAKMKEFEERDEIPIVKDNLSRFRPTGWRHWSTGKHINPFPRYSSTPATLIEDKTVDGKRQFTVSSSMGFPKGPFTIVIEGKTYDVELRKDE